MTNLEDIRSRLSAATPGPWADMGSNGAFSGEIRACADFAAICRDPDGDDRPADRALIAHAPSDITALLAEVDRLRVELAEALATVANERGEGEPPDPSFNWRGGRWVSDTLGVQVILLGGRGWHVEDLWYDAHVQHSEPAHPSARAAMRAAAS